MHMNYLTHQLLNAEEINFIEKELEKKIKIGKMGKKLLAVMPQR